jgi:Restriction endonuclease
MKSTDYELLVREIYQQLLAQDEVPNIVVEHDALKQGIATKHQIDVYWEFRLGGLIHRVAVQAKQWARPVDKGELLKFKGVLADLPGTLGVMVTAQGYQVGALDVAATYGIKIYELKEEAPEPLMELALGEKCTFTFKGFRMAGEKPFAFLVQQEITRHEFSNVMLQGDLPQSGIAESPLNIQAIPRDVEFYTSEGKLLCTLQDIYTEMALEVSEASGLHVHKTHAFDQPVFLKVPTMPALVKITSLSANITQRSRSRETEWRVENIAIFILRDLTDGVAQRFVRIP